MSDTGNEPSAGGAGFISRWRRLTYAQRALGGLALMIVFALWAHFASGVPVFRTHASTPPGWPQFRAAYGVESFGVDGYFTRAAQHGYALFYFTPQYGERFTRKTVRDRANSCSACHTVEDLAYAFVNSDRYDPKLGKRVSFEERVMRCYAGPMDGFVPTLYDPAVRDIRILARAVANHLRLSEGVVKKEGG
jgi:hypothetical protein